MQVRQYVLSDPAGNYVYRTPSLDEAKRLRDQWDDRDEFGDGYHVIIGREYENGHVEF